MNREAGTSSRNKAMTEHNTIPQAPQDDEAFKQWYVYYHGWLHSEGQGCPSCDRYRKLMEPK